LKIFQKIFFILLISIPSSPALYAFQINHLNKTILNRNTAFTNKNNQFYQNSFIKRNNNYKYEFGFSAHLFYPKVKLEKLFETSFGLGISASYRIYPKWNAGISLSFTPLVPISEFNKSNLLKSAYIFNTSILLKYMIAQEIFLNTKAGFLYYSVTTNSFNTDDTESSGTLPDKIKTGTWCPVISLGPSFLFTWIKNVNFMLDLSYNTFFFDASYRYYFLAKITISFVK